METNTTTQKINDPQIDAEIAAIDAKENPTNGEKMISCLYKLSKHIDQCLEQSIAKFGTDSDHILDSCFAVAAVRDEIKGGIIVQCATMGDPQDMTEAIFKTTEANGPLRNMIVNVANWILMDEYELSLTKIIEQAKDAKAKGKNMEMPAFEDSSTEVDFYLRGLIEAVQNRQAEKIQVLKDNGITDQEIAEKYILDNVIVLGAKVHDLNVGHQDFELFDSIGGHAPHLGETLLLYMRHDIQLEHLLKTVVTMKISEDLNNITILRTKNGDKVETKADSAGSNS